MSNKAWYSFMGVTTFVFSLYVALLPLTTEAAVLTEMGSTPELNGENIFSRYYSLNDNGYIVKFQKKQRSIGINENQRTIYRLNEVDGVVNLEEIKKFSGGKYKYSRQHDDLFEFGNDLYFTMTRGAGKKTDLYRSTDDGSSWDKVAELGFSKPHFENDIKDISIVNDTAYIVVGQEDDDANRQKVGVWSSSTGSSWQKTILTFSTAQPVTKYIYDDSLNSDQRYYVIISAVRRAEDNTVGEKWPDLYDQIVFSSTDGINWTEQKMMIDEFPTADAVSYSSDQVVVAEDGTLYISARATQLSYNDTTQWYDYDSTNDTTTTIKFIWATSDNSTSSSTQIDIYPTLIANDSGIYALAETDETTVTAFALNYDATTNITTITETDYFTVDENHSPHGSFRTFGNYTAYVVNNTYYYPYEITIFFEGKWSDTYTLKQQDEHTDEDDESDGPVETFSAYNQHYFYSFVEKELYSITSTGRLETTTLKLPDGLDNTILSAYGYDRNIGGKTLKQGTAALLCTQHDCFVTDSSLTWQTLDRSYREAFTKQTIEWNNKVYLFQDKSVFRLVIE